MATPVDMSAFVKASDVVVSLFKKASDHAPFLIALFITFVAISFTPVSFFPIYLHDFKWAFPFLSIFLGVYILLSSYYAQRRFLEARSHLKHIGEDEKSLLRTYLEQNVSCQMLSPILNGSAATLISKGILTVSSSMFSALNAPVAIQPFFQVYLRKHPELVGLKATDIGKQKYDDGTSPDLDGF